MSFFDPLLGRVRAGLRKEKVIEKQTKVIERRSSGGNPLPQGGTTNQVLTKRSNQENDLKWADAAGGGTWGSITGTLSDQTDLQTALNAKGDASTNTATSVDSEIAVFSGTGGKTIKRASTTGIVKASSGVISAAVSGTDYAPATSGTSILKGNGSGGFSNASAGTDYYNPGGTDVAVADGGTGASTLTANNVILGNGTSAVQFVAPSTSGNILTSNGTTWTSAAPAASGGTPKGRFFLAEYDKRLGGDTSDGVLQKSNSGAGSASNYTASTGGWTLETGSTSTGYAYISNSRMNILRSSGTWFGSTLFDRSPIFQCLGAIQTGGADCRIFIGMGGAAGTLTLADNSNKSMGFLFERASSTNTWYACTGNGTTLTKTDITSAVTAVPNYEANNSAIPMFFVAQLTSGTNAKFYVNGTLVHTSTTTLPAGQPSIDFTWAHAFITNTAGTTSNLFCTPYIGFEFNLY